MAKKGLVLRQWDETPINEGKVVLVTKFTDLGTPDSEKIVFGWYFNISLDTKKVTTTSLNPNSYIAYNSSYEFKLSYRDAPLDNWKHLVTISNYLHSANLGWSQPLKQFGYFENYGGNFRVINLQLKIESSLVGTGFGLNDFGIMYRNYRTSTIEKHDED